ncbi:MAG: Crp/Fnr family transcriptional regulator [Desulfovibrionaceae bacterium]|nr:Crp/Fnr family transcriptional regulator [Desulfovibrionaceae bacterium]
MRTVECLPAARLLQIKRVAMFDGVSESTLATLVSTAVLQEFDAQEVLAQEGEDAEACYALIRGLVKVVHRQSSGREHIIHMVSEGATIGESAMFRQKHWPSTAVALEKSLVLRLERKAMNDAARQDPDFAVHLLGVFSLRLRMCVKKLSNQGINASQRVGRYILHRAIIEDKTTLRLKMSREEMANMLGITRETLSRVLSRLVGERILSVQGRIMTVLDMEALQNLADQE